MKTSETTGRPGQGNAHETRRQAEADARRRRQKRGSFSRWTAPLRAALATIVFMLSLLPIAAQSEVLLDSTVSTGVNHGTDFYAQQFTTGSNSGGYTITNVQIDIQSASGTATTAVGIRDHSSDNGGTPGSIIATFTNPTNLSVGLNTFTAPANTTLAANTQYYISINHGITGDKPRIRRAGVASLTVTGAAGWSLDRRYLRTSETDPWAFSSSSKIKLRINGDPITNTAATGAPTISGAARVGEVLTAEAGDMADLDVLPTTTFPAGYTFQWVRTDSGTDTDISGATSRTYTLQSADQGKTVKVKVSFTDGGGTTETLTSDAFPETGTIAATPPALQVPVFISNTEVIEGEGSTGESPRAMGFNTGTGGYTLGSIGIGIKAVPASGVTPQVQIYADDNSNPGTLVATLTNPTTYTANAVNYFTAPMGTTLGSNETYWVVANNTGSSSGSGFIFQAGFSSATDSGAAAGWSLVGSRVKDDITDTAWQSSGVYFSVEVRGTPLANAPPTSADATVTATEGTAYTFGTSNFTFADTDSGNTLQRISVTTLPATGFGTLSFDGNRIFNAHLPRRVTSTELAAGKLVFTPVAGQFQDDYATFDFKVNDGIEDSAAAYTMTIDVNAAASHRVLVSNLRETVQDTAYFIGNASAKIATQGFHTGNHGGGYRLHSVGIDLDDNSFTGSETLSLFIYSSNEDGTANAQVHALTTPWSTGSEIPEDGAIYFTAASGAMLSANTDYHVVVQASGNTSFEAAIELTGSNSESGEPHWTIENAYRRNGSNSVSLDAFRIAVRGTPIGTENAAATGAPTISGTATVGQILTANAGDMADAEGLPTTTFPAGYTFQWVRTDGSTDTDITGATSRTYTLQSADQGKTVKVKVSFTDRAGNSETLTSAAFPSSGTVEAATASDAHCDPTDTNEIWCATLTAGAVLNLGHAVGYGFVAVSNEGSLTDTSFTYNGTTYNVSHLYRENVQTNRRLVMGFDGSGESVFGNNGFALIANTDRFSYGDAVWQTGLNFVWSDSGLSWTTSDTIQVKLVKVPTDTTPPTVTITDVPAETSSYFFAKFTFSEPVTGFALDDINVGQSLGAATVTGLFERTRGRVYTARITPLRTGTGSITVKANAVQDAGGNGNAEVAVNYLYRAPGRAAASFEMVSNLYLTTDDTLSVNRNSQGFTTGNHAGGYRLTRIKLGADGSARPDEATLHLGTRTGTEIGRLRANNGPRNILILNPTAPIVLEPNTTYVIVTGANTGTGNWFISSDEDDTSADGWSLAYGFDYYQTGTATWQRYTFGSLLLSIEARKTIAANASTGEPEITGWPGVGQTVYASRGTVEDRDGVPTRSNFRYQWIRTDGSTDTEITGETGDAYTLTSADEGKQIKVRLSFNDTNGERRQEESRTSRAWPSGSTIVAPPTAPPNFTVESGFGRARLRWDLPANTTQSEINYWEYRNTITLFSEGPVPPLPGGVQHVWAWSRLDLADTDQRTLLLTGMTNAPTHFQIRAVSKGGPGARATVSGHFVGNLGAGVSCDVVSAFLEPGTRTLWRGTMPHDRDAQRGNVSGFRDGVPGVSDSGSINGLVGTQGGAGFTLDSTLHKVSAFYTEALRSDTEDDTRLHLRITPEIASATTRTSFKGALTLRYCGWALQGADATVTSGNGATTLTWNSSAVQDLTLVSAEAGSKPPSIGIALVVGKNSNVGRSLAQDTRFQNVPERHDGQTAFTVDVRFGAKPAGLATKDAASIFEVSGGTITGATLKGKGAMPVWTLTIRPSGTGGVTVRLPARACTEAHAVCSGGQPLENALEAIIEGDPITGTLTGAPAAHDGRTRFTTQLEFSHTPRGLSWRTVRDRLFAVDGGQVTRVRRTQRGSSQRWELSIQPLQRGALTLTANATTDCSAQYKVCDREGRRFDGDLSLTVRGPETRPPAIDSATTIDAAEGGTAVATLTATDADTEIADLFWSIPADGAGDDAAHFNLAPDGVLTFAQAKDFDAPDDADADGAYEVTVQVDDGVVPVKASLTVRLTEVDNTAPALESATVDATVLTLTYDEAFDADGVPAASAFSVTVAGAARTVESVEVTDKAVALTLASAVASGETVTVDYTIPTGEDAAPLADEAGNRAPSFTGQAVTNETGAGEPTVSIAAASTPVTEGTAAAFTLTRTGATDDALTVTVAVTEAGTVLDGTPATSVTFAEEAATASFSVATDDDAVDEADAQVQVAISSAEGYQVDTGAGTARVDVFDNDAAAASDGVEDLWSTTLTWTDIGGGWAGGYADSFAQSSWTEDGSTFRIWYIALNTRTGALFVAHDGSGGSVPDADELTMRIGDVEVARTAMQLFAEASVATMHGVGSQWSIGDEVPILLTRTSGDAASTSTGPTVSVADAQVREAAGTPLAFQVTLSEAASSTVSVRYRSSDGTATAGEDYTAVHGALRFAPGETVKTVSVDVIEDAHDEGSETMTLTLSEPFGATVLDGSGTGTINNTDPMPQAWIARFGRTVAEQAIEAVEARFSAPRHAGFTGRIGGQSLPGFGASSESNPGSESGAGSGESGAQEDTRGPTRTAYEDGLRGLRIVADRLADSQSASDTESTLDPQSMLDSQSALGPDSRSVLDQLSVFDRDNRAPEARGLTGRDMLTGTSFSLTRGTAETGFASIWGRGAVTRFDGHESNVDGGGGLSLDGEVTSAMLGADFSTGRVLAGLMLSRSRGEGGYRSAEGDAAGSGRIESTLTALFPYGQLALNERVSVWGMAGFGEGTLTLTPEEGKALRPDLSFLMGAAGMRGTILDGDEGGPVLVLKSDAMAVRTSTDAVSGDAGNLAAADGDVTRLRLALEGSRPITLNPGGEAGPVLTPSLEIGMRHDGGDAETGFGADIGAGLALADPARGISSEIRVRGVLTHEDDGMRARGVSGSLAWDPAPETERGLSLDLTQTFGGLASGASQTLFGQAVPVEQDVTGDELDRQRLDARLGYGFGVFEDRWTAMPALGLGLSDSDREVRLGGRLARRVSAGLDFGIDLEGTRREFAGGEAGPEHGLLLGFGWRLAGRSMLSFEMRLEGTLREAANDNTEAAIGLRIGASW